MAASSLIVSVILCLGLVACSPQPANDAVPPLVSVSNVLSTKPSAIELQEVVDTFAVGSDRTDLQRDQLGSRWIGSVVLWDIEVYNIEASGSRYRVTSDQRSPFSPIPFLVAADVEPRSEEDVELLLKVRTGDRMRLLGSIDAIRLRTMLILSPAVISR